MDTALDHLERTLTGRDHLMSDGFGTADASCSRSSSTRRCRARRTTTSAFHRILDEHQSAGGRPRLRAWIGRVDARPRA
jgi:glutathione S-transferase